MLPIIRSSMAIHGMAFDFENRIQTLGVACEPDETNGDATIFEKLYQRLQAAV